MTPTDQSSAGAMSSGSARPRSRRGSDSWSRGSSRNGARPNNTAEAVAAAEAAAAAARAMATGNSYAPGVKRLGN